MRRHILLRRQWRYFRLTPSFLKKRRPLVKRILEQHELLTALGFHSVEMENRIFTIQADTPLSRLEEAEEPLALPVALEEEEEQAPVTVEETLLPVTAEENVPPTVPEEKMLPIAVEEKKPPIAERRSRRPLPIREQPLEKETISTTSLSRQAGEDTADGAAKKAADETHHLERELSIPPISQVDYSPASEEQATSTASDNGQSTFDPQYWLARLTEMAQREQQQQTPGQQQQKQIPEQQGRVSPQIQPRRPAFISQGTRTFLKPLVGIDPAEVPVYQDRRAAQETTALQADALNVGETIELAPEYRDGKPETLGLLAHELTHVARKRQPHFVPPIMRPRTASTGEIPAMPVSIGEEALALGVERQVRHAASREERGTLPVVPSRAKREQGETPEEVNGQRDRSVWGELPAPWEPLPTWLAYPPATDGPVVSPPSQASIAPAPRLSAPAPAYRSAQQGIAGDSSAQGEVMRASTDRDVEDVPTGGQPSQPHPARKAPEPDLNEMAQQVYERLKRRLLVEQRRELS